MDLIPDIQSHAEKLTIIGLLAIVLAGLLLAFWRKWVVWGWTYDEVVKDRDMYRTNFFRQIGINEDAIFLAKRAREQQEVTDA